MITIQQTLGERVKTTRISKKLSQSDLAKKIGISQGTIAHIENGRNKDTKHIFSIAKALNVSVEWLYYGDTSNKNLWPFFSITKQQYDSLSDQIKEEIENFIQYHLSKSH